MSKQITGILKAPSGATLTNQSVGLVAIRSTPPSIVKGAKVSFTTDASGFYDVDVENGYFRVTAESESGGDIALGTIYINDGGSSDLPTLLSISEEPNTPVNDALQALADSAAQSALEAQQAADSIDPSDYVQAIEKGVANGVAELDSGGKVPPIQLPSYVDDVVEYPDFASLPAVGESGKIYITLDNGKSWRWASTAYVEISASMSGSEIKALYEAEPDTNAFNDSDKTKLSGIEAGADVSAVDSVDGRTGAVTLDDLYATSAQGIKADTAHGWGDHASAGYLPATGKSADSDLLDGIDGQYYFGRNSGTTTQDPDLASAPVIMTTHPNVPTGSGYWHITTTFYSSITSTANRAQLAVRYTGGNQAYVRSCYLGVWTSWVRVDNDGTAATATKVTDQNGGTTKFWSGTQAEYDALTPDASTMYVVTG